MENAVNTPEAYRYERKFMVTDRSRDEIECLVKLHPAIFSEIYHERNVNNVYFDSFSMKNYFANIDGLFDRTKYRIRWYGDLLGEIEKPVLELKIKKGLLGRKASYHLAPYTFDSNFQNSTIQKVFKESDLPDYLKLDLETVEPTLLNRYTRRYYQSADRNFRITIDTQMEFYRIDHYGNTFLHKSVDDRNIIVELKYNFDDERVAERISDYLPFRLSRNSKYVNGIQRVYMD